MYYLGMFAWLGIIIAALGIVKNFDLSTGMTAALAIPTVLLGVVGIAWLAAKDSAAGAAGNKTN